MSNIFTKEQTERMRRLYAQDIPLDEVSRDYVSVILACLDTIDDLRIALKIANKEGEYAPIPMAKNRLFSDPGAHLTEIAQYPKDWESDL